MLNERDLVPDFSTVSSEGVHIFGDSGSESDGVCLQMVS